MTDDFYIPPVTESPAITEEEKGERRTSFISCVVILILITAVLILAGYIGATSQDFGKYTVMIVAVSLGYSYARNPKRTV